MKFSQIIATFYNLAIFYSEILLVLCHVNVKEGTIRLVGGKSKYEGNVQIYHLGRWGQVCDDEWGTEDGAVVCRELGKLKLHGVTSGSYFGQFKKKFWMDSVWCTGYEAALSTCRFDGWGQHDCKPNEAAGVICEPPSKSQKHKPPQTGSSRIVAQPRRVRIGGHFGRSQLRLVGGRSRNEGRVEVKFKQGEFGTICGDGWSILEAAQVCAHLNLGYAAGAPTHQEPHGNTGYSTTFRDRPSNSRQFANYYEEQLGYKYPSSNEIFQANQVSQTHGHFERKVDRHSPRGNIALYHVKCGANSSSWQHCTTLLNVKECPGNIRAGVICTRELPDLEIDWRAIEQTIHLQDKQLYYLQCAMEENCLAAEAYRLKNDNTDGSWYMETRRLLRFTARTTNIGNADFRPFIPKYLWKFHQCHLHYHSMEVFATFDILARGSNQKVAQGHKASFCLEDNECSQGRRRRYFCANFGDQGVSPNCSDVYKFDIDCQWIDISELNPGLYTFRVTINPEYKVPEQRYDNNAVTCSLYYDETYVRLYGCYLGDT